ncbi:MAG: RimJ/RimL family protein N-acetyltransferase [Flavobacteriales bacterium]|jgi:RimJ/RimL family protein N-acetyltransferase
MRTLIESDHIRLEALSDQHFDALLEITLSQPDLLQFSPSPFGSAEALRLNFDQALATRKLGVRYPFAIFDKKSQSYVGSTSFAGYSVKDKRLEIGWTWIRKEFQGTGFNGICKQIMLSYAFNELKVERVEFKIDSRNVRSRKAVEKLGATLEGELRNHTVMSDGFRRNTCIYSILKTEFTG